MSYRELMELPVKTFWLMYQNIRRIKAEDDLRSLQNTISAQGAEGYTEHHEALVLELGEVVVADKAVIAMEAQRDEEGIEALKQMV